MTESSKPREFWLYESLKKGSGAVHYVREALPPYKHDWPEPNSVWLRKMPPLKLIEASAHDAALARIAILESQASQFESTIKETMRVKDEKIKLLEEVCAELMGALKIISNDLDMIGVTPTEVSHLAISRNALASAREKIKETKEK